MVLSPWPGVPRRKERAGSHALEAPGYRAQAGGPKELLAARRVGEQAALPSGNGIPVRELRAAVQALVAVLSRQLGAMVARCC